MIDLVHLHLVAGDGGHGRVCLHREKYMPKGGPDGGNGGDGGSIIFRVNPNLNTLRNFVGEKKMTAEAGEAGGKNKRQGKKGDTTVLEVPPGTVVWLVAENEVSRRRRLQFRRPILDQASQPYHQLLAQLGVKAEQPNLTGGQAAGKDSSPAVAEASEKKAADQASSVSVSASASTSASTTGNRNSVQVAAVPNILDDLTKIIRRDEIEFEKYYLQKEGERVAEKTEELLVAPEISAADQQAGREKKFSPEDRIPDLADDFSAAGLKIVELLEPGQEVVICQGGFGGRGNDCFKSSVNQTPLEAEYGTAGEQKEVILELRLLADIGLIGWPNAGKSTLLSKVTKANPKIANYPFTTLEPNLGILSLTEQQKVVLADLPGLIAGASQGKGLGDRFLRHVEHCRALVYVLFLDESLVFDENLTLAAKAKLVWEQYQELAAELAQYAPELVDRPTALTLNKIDIYSDELIDAVVKLFKLKNRNLITFSGVSGQGLTEVKQTIQQLLAK